MHTWFDAKHDQKSWMVSSTYVVRVSKGGKKNYYYEWGEKHLSLGTHKLGACKTMSNDNSKKIPCLPKRITFSFSHKKEIRCSSDLGLPLVWHCHLKMQIKSCSLVCTYTYIIFVGSEICRKTSSLGLRMSLKEWVNDV